MARILSNPLGCWDAPKRNTHFQFLPSVNLQSKRVVWTYSVFVWAALCCLQMSTSNWMRQVSPHLTESHNNDNNNIIKLVSKAFHSFKLNRKKNVNTEMIGCIHPLHAAHSVQTPSEPQSALWTEGQSHRWHSDLSFHLSRAAMPFTVFRVSEKLELLHPAREQSQA